jgi:hypothetical protein
MGSNELERILGVVPSVRPQLSQPDLLSFRHRRLDGEAANDRLTGRIDPVRRQRVNDLVPNARLKEGSSSAGGYGRPRRGSIGTTESEAADLRPRGMRKTPFPAGC